MNDHAATRICPRDEVDRGNLLGAANVASARVLRRGPEDRRRRHLVIDPSYIHAADAIGGVGRLLVPLALLVGTFALGLWVFNRDAPRIAEEL